MKSKLLFLFVAAGLTLFTTSADTTRFVNAKYIISSNPTVCQGPETLPANCSAVPSGTICRVPFGQYQKTYMQGTSCTLDYFYKIL